MKQSEENSKIASWMLVKLGRYFWQKLWMSMQQKSPHKTVKGARNGHQSL